MSAQLTELLTRYGPIGGVCSGGWWDRKNNAMRDRWRPAAGEWVRVVKLTRARR